MLPTSRPLQIGSDTHGVGPRVHTLTEAAQLTGKSRASLERRVERGTLRHVKNAAGLIVIPHTELVARGLLDEEGRNEQQRMELVKWEARYDAERQAHEQTRSQLAAVQSQAVDANARADERSRQLTEARFQLENAVEAANKHGRERNEAHRAAAEAAARADELRQQLAATAPQLESVQELRRQLTEAQRQAAVAKVQADTLRSQLPWWRRRRAAP